ncbi:hypothetical protein D3C77_653130 [compost metagenome]
MDRVHQLGREREVVEAGLAFGRFDGEILECPGVRHRLARSTFAARLGGFGGFLHGRLLAGGGVLLAGGSSGLARRFAGGAAGSARSGRRGGSVRGGRGDADCGLFTFAEYFLECFEHGGLDN